MSMPYVFSIKYLLSAYPEAARKEDSPCTPCSKMNSTSGSHSRRIESQARPPWFSDLFPPLCFPVLVLSLYCSSRFCNTRGHALQVRRGETNDIQRLRIKWVWSCVLSLLYPFFFFFPLHGGRHWKDQETRKKGSSQPSRIWMQSIGAANCIHIIKQIIISLQV